MSRYRFIHAERATYPVTILCRVLGVARSAYYAWAGGGVSARAQADVDPTTQISAVHARSRRTYGAPRLRAELRAAGVRCARLWFGDITYVAPREGWRYLAVLRDAHSRRVVGWAMADHLRTELALDALTMALARRRPGAGLVLHTDRGCQYTAAAYQDALAAHGLVCSTSRSGNGLDNAMAESVFATLKAELVDQHPWPTRAAAKTAVFAAARGRVQPPAPPLCPQLSATRDLRGGRVVVVWYRRLALHCPCKRDNLTCRRRRAAGHRRGHGPMTIGRARLGNAPHADGGHGGDN